MASPFVSAGAVLTGVFILQGGLGLLASFLALRMTLEGFPTAVIGLVVTAYPLGFLLGCLFAAHLVRSVGHIRAFAVFAAAACLATLAFALLVEPLFWSVLRLLTGYAAAGLFMIGESWLNARTPSAVRGTVFAIYMISGMAAISAGQLLLAIADPLSLTLFMVAAALFNACLIPVALTRAPAPELPEVAALGLRGLYRVSPLAVVGCAATGLVNTAVGGVGPVFAARVGMDSAEIATFMAVLLFGGLLLQWPIGRLSDRFDRRRVLLAITLALLALSLVIAAYATADRLALLAMVLLFGGLAYTIYPLCVAHASDYAEPSQMVAISAGLLLSWATGSIFGPTLATLAMSVVGPGGLFGYVATVMVLLALYIVWRMSRRAPLPADQQAPFQHQPQTTPVAAGLSGRSEPAPETGPRAADASAGR